jgi:hypothetical protein
MLHIIIEKGLTIYRFPILVFDKWGNILDCFNQATLNNGIWQPVKYRRREKTVIFLVESYKEKSMNDE